MSDGECNEGSVWEAALSAGKHKLNDLTVLVDYNKHQSYSSTNEVQDLEPVADKWKAFGFAVAEVDGHDHQTLFDELTSNAEQYPKMIIAYTIKGKGVSFMEDDNNWHYRVPTMEEMQRAKVELGFE